LDDALTNDAKKYAQYLADNKKFEHSGAQGQGENLFMSSGNASLLDATRAWLAEKPNYHGENIADGNFGSYGHYTQVCLSTQIPFPDLTDDLSQPVHLADDYQARACRRQGLEWRDLHRS
jgi:hypothetical protein